MESGFPLYVVLVLRYGAIGSAADSDSDGSKFESWCRSIIVISIVPQRERRPQSSESRFDSYTIVLCARSSVGRTLDFLDSCRMIVYLRKDI